MTSSEDTLFISDLVIFVYIWVTYGVFFLIINIFGIIANVTNIICFTKLGFEESVNISLLALAVSDLGISAMMVLMCISVNPSVTAADLPFEPGDVSYLVFIMPRLFFSRVSSCITAMIVTERCLCITNPLKIKRVITPKRVTIATVSVFILFFCTGVPVWTVNSLGLTFSPLRNKTLVGMISTGNREYVEMMSFAINNFCIPFVAFVIIVVCTAILSLKLRNQSKWRQNALSSSQVDLVSTRNKNAAKMVMIVSTLFIFCFIPVCVIMLAVGFVPELSINQKHFKITLIISVVGNAMENFNSSGNIFIYFHMSSKYRGIFKKLLNNVVFKQLQKQHRIR